MTLQEKKVELRKWLGKYNIHALGTQKGAKIVVYHNGNIPDNIKKQIESEASPHPVEWKNEPRAVMASL